MNLSIGNISEKVFDNFKKITPGLVAITIITGLLLFLPHSVLEKMNLNDLPIIWNRIIGICFLLSIAIILTVAFFSMISVLEPTIREKRLKKNLKKKYLSLSSSQKSIVLQMLRSTDKTIALDKNSGDTVYLVNNLFLYMPDQVFTLGWDNEMVLTYVPHPWLLDLFNEEPELFK